MPTPLLYTINAFLVPLIVIMVLLLVFRLIGSRKRVVEAVVADPTDPPTGPVKTIA